MAKIYRDLAFVVYSRDPFYCRIVLVYRVHFQASDSFNKMICVQQEIVKESAQLKENFLPT